MLFSELLQDEFTAGKAQGEAIGEAKGEAKGKAYSIIVLLDMIGNVSEELASKIGQVTDAEKQDALLKLAAVSKTVEEFEEKAGL
ncbi:MAG: hypothetical protein ACI4EX_12865 [Lachnospiraceae bacterium]